MDGDVPITITLPRDGAVLTGAADELVYLVLTYHFGAT